MFWEIYFQYTGVLQLKENHNFIATIVLFIRENSAF